MTTLRFLEKYPPQLGVIVFGGGLDVRNALAEARSRGWHVLICGDHARLYR